MDKTNQKVLTLSFVIFAALCGITVSLLLKVLSGAFGVVAQMTSHDMIKHGLPVVVGMSLFAVLQFNKSVLGWAEEVVVEIRKVIWPSRKDTTGMTWVVIVMVMISAVIITFFDLVSTYIINYFIK